MKKIKGTTLIELLTIIFIVSLIVGTVAAIFTAGWKNYHQQSAQIDTQERAKSSVSTTTAEIRKANRILYSYNFWIGELCGQYDVKKKSLIVLVPSTLALRPCAIQAFISDSTHIVMSMPSIDNNNNVIPNHLDYEVIYLDTASQNLKSLKNRWDGSQYLREEKTITTNTESITFTYEPAGGNITDTERVTISMTTFQTGGGETNRTTLTSSAKLRNK